MRRTRILAFLLLLSCSHLLPAAKIGEVAETDWQSQALRFLTLEDTAVRYAVLGSIFLGATCGLLGSFIVVRRMALMGDTLSHAVLPGVAIGFLVSMSKDPLSILLGATLAGLLGVACVQWIRRTTPIKEDAAMGMVLAGFYALGITLFTMIQNLPTGNKSGLNAFLFGQVAALSQTDVLAMATLSVLSILAVVLFYKEFLSVSFDPGFAHASGLATTIYQTALMALLAVAIVISLQAVGVVLVSAMLITPAATAYLLTDRLHRMLWLAALFGIGAGLLGAFASFLGNHLPTGPFMVIAATLLFTIALFWAPRHGIVARWQRNWRRSRRIQMENTLKAIYQVREQQNFTQDGVRLRELALRRNEPLPEAEAQAHALVKAGYATLSQMSGPQPGSAENTVFLTPKGWERACAVVRNHRLWELYLTEAADYEADHVHDDAEVIEHLLGEKTVQALERRLHHPRQDPHGKLIPSIEDMHDISARPGRPLKEGMLS